MKKILLTAVILFATGYAMAQQRANCFQQYVCGPAGCQWVVVCR